MILSKEETKKILERVLKLCKADSARVSLSGEEEKLVRYANNMVFTNLSKSTMNLGISVAFENKKGNSSTNQFDEDSLKKCVQRAEQIAKYAPPDPEFLPPLEPQQYKEIKAFIKDTAEISPEEKTKKVMDIIKHGQKKEMNLFGTFSNSAAFFAIANSKGLFGYHKYTSANCTTTARTKDGTGSSRATKDNRDIKKLDTFGVGKEAIEKALKSRNPKEIEPGDYTVVFEPEALADLVLFMYFFIDARAADEGRSFMSTKDGKSKLGTKVFGENVTVKSIPDHPDLLSFPFDNEGIPSREITWLDKGVVKNLYYSRYWAKKKGKKPSSFSGGIVMEGGQATMEQLIKSVKKGIYVPRLWYIRDVNPMTLLLTGLTRDGVFLIEDGRLKHPLLNLRFNESLETVLNSITMLTKPEIAIGSEFGWPMLIPGAKVENFTFSSIAPSV
ncbi:MAG: TldD/PmbA family protein [Candidatus Aminicenantes bacterium]|nr:TldD/PmbA family protein [Candidatus Aminicenantes bacterium]